MVGFSLMLSSMMSASMLLKHILFYLFYNYNDTITCPFQASAHLLVGQQDLPASLSIIYHDIDG